MKIKKPNKSISIDRLIDLLLLLFLFLSIFTEQQDDPTITANKFPPDEQFEVQTEPPVLPDTSSQSSDESPANEPEYEDAPITDEPDAPLTDEPPIYQPPPQQQQQLEQEYYQKESEAQFTNQNQQQHDAENDESQSSQSENESMHDAENNYEQQDYEISNAPIESKQFDELKRNAENEAMQTDETNENVNESANQLNTETNNEQKEPLEIEQTMETETETETGTEELRSNEPAKENIDEEETKNGDEAELKSPARDKEKQGSIDKDSDKQESRKRKRSPSKSKSPPAKRANRRASPARNTDDFTNEEDEPEFDENAVVLSWYDSDLNLSINKPELCSARPLSDGALALAWAGARSTYGVDKGKVCYEVQVNEINRIQNLSDERNLYELRCGWSIMSDNLQLGESPLSFGYSGCAKKANDSTFSEYGIKYGSRGDVVGVYLDLDSTPCTIQYTVNGEPQGTAFEFDKEELNGAALYPHILTKNLAFTVNFGQSPKLLVNEERPNRARRDESSRRDSTRRSNKDSRKSGSPASGTDEKEKTADKIDEEKSETKQEREQEQDQEQEREQKREQKREQEREQEESAEQAEQAEQAERAEQPEKASEEEKSAATSENGDNTDADDKNGERNEKDKPNELQQNEYTLLPGYELIGTIGNDNLVQGYQRPQTRKECEVILIIGLPSAGKTHWANQHSKDNVEKHYNILGVQNLLSKMTVSVFVAVVFVVVALLKCLPSTD